MTKQPKPPKTFQEVEDYINEKGLCVDPKWFWEFFEAGNWYDSNGKPVLCWKQKLFSLNKMQMEWGGAHKCSYSSCKRPGVYPAGKDRDGHPLYKCILHKPKYEPILPKSMSMNILKDVNKDINKDVNDERNRQRKELGL